LTLQARATPLQVVYWLYGKSWYGKLPQYEECYHFGSALASFCVEKFGTEKIKNLTQTEIAGRIQEFVNLSSFEIK